MWIWKTKIVTIKNNSDWNLGNNNINEDYKKDKIWPHIRNEDGGDKCKFKI